MFTCLTASYHACPILTPQIGWGCLKPSMLQLEGGEWVGDIGHLLAVPSHSLLLSHMKYMMLLHHNVIVVAIVDVLIVIRIAMLFQILSCLLFVLHAPFGKLFSHLEEILPVILKKIIRNGKNVP